MTNVFATKAIKAFLIILNSRISCLFSKEKKVLRRSCLVLIWRIFFYFFSLKQWEKIIGWCLRGLAWNINNRSKILTPLQWFDWFFEPRFKKWCLFSQNQSRLFFKKSENLWKIHIGIYFCQIKRNRDMKMTLLYALATGQGDQNQKLLIQNGYDPMLVKPKWVRKVCKL